MRAIDRLRFIVTEFVLRFMRDGQLKTAAALTYTTLFAVVPLMTVMYAVLSVMPEFSSVGPDIEQFIFRNFVPASGEQLREQLHSFSEQARGLTLLGSALLLVTSYLLLVNVEQSFNQIWGVSEPRKGMSRLLLYWAVLTFGPPALALGTFVSSYVLSFPLLSDVDGVDLRARFLVALPWLISGVSFTALFYAVPNCVVRLTHALCGGIATMLCFHLALRVFSLFFAQSGVQVVYGTFAAVPLFLTWVYLCWAMILGGALLVKLMSEPIRPRTAVSVPALVGALALLRNLHVAHHEGRSLSHDAVLAQLTGVPHALGLMQRLQATGIVVRTEQGGWMLGRDLDRVTLWKLSEVLNGDLGWSGNWHGIDPRVAARLDAALAAARSHLDISLEDLLQLGAA